MKIPVILLSALALAAPGSTSFAKDKGKNKDKDKSSASTGQADDRGGRHHDDHGDDNGDKVTICHVPGGNPGNRHTITVGASAWEAHRNHGDTRGACGANNPGPGNDRFDALDRNDDGVISKGEWTGDSGTFDRLDRNDDGVISRREFSRL